MRNIAHKFETLRTAKAESIVKMRRETVQLLKDGKAPKGDPLPLARVAAIMAAKNTSDLIPYCHPLLIDAVTVEFELNEDNVKIEVVVTAVAKTGVEMEALTGASLAALTIYDMLKPVDDDLEIMGCRLLDKKGGKSGLPSGAPEGLRAAVIIVSDTVSAGVNQDTSGKILAERLIDYGVKNPFVVPVADNRPVIAAKLLELCDAGYHLILTTGGTGLGPRDVTVEATQDVIERDAPGISEAMRAYGQRRTPYAMMSRGISGVRGNSLIINLPGSPAGVEESLTAVFPALFHFFPVMAGERH